MGYPEASVKTTNMLRNIIEERRSRLQRVWGYPEASVKTTNMLRNILEERRSRLQRVWNLR